MNKSLAGISLGIIAGFALVSVTHRRKQKDYPPLPVATYVDLSRYAGEWYEIARMPARFEKECYASKARYTLQTDGSLQVLNTCNKEGINGKLKKAAAKAYVTEPASNAKLKVQFF